MYLSQTAIMVPKEAALQSRLIYAICLRLQIVLTMFEEIIYFYGFHNSNSEFEAIERFT